MDEKAFFYIFSSLALLAASGVVVSKNLIRSVLFLILLFITTAALWLLLDAEFLSLLLALIYIGAVLVLFLFVIMIFDLNFQAKEQRFNWFEVLAVSMVGVLLGLLTYVVALQGFNLDSRLAVVGPMGHQSELVYMGELLFTKYLIPFEISGILLLVAIVAVVSLAVKDPK